MLYGVPVLIAATIMVSFGMSLVTDPLSQLTLIPNVSPETIQNIVDRQRLDEPMIVQYSFWLKDAIFNQFGHLSACHFAAPLEITPAS